MRRTPCWTSTCGAKRKPNCVQAVNSCFDKTQHKAAGLANSQLRLQGGDGFCSRALAFHAFEQQSNCSISRFVMRQPNGGKSRPQAASQPGIVVGFSPKLAGGQ